MIRSKEWNFTLIFFRAEISICTVRHIIFLQDKCAVFHVPKLDQKKTINHVMAWERKQRSDFPLSLFLPTPAPPLFLTSSCSSPLASSLPLSKTSLLPVSSFLYLFSSLPSLCCFSVFFTRVLDSVSEPRLPPCLCSRQSYFSLHCLASKERICSLND